VPCPLCGQPCRFLGPTIEIPPKRAEAAWDELRSEVDKFHASQVDRRSRKLVRSRHDLEQRIRELQGRPKSAGREQLIKELQEQLGAGV